jgi:hypothetical protein
MNITENFFDNLYQILDDDNDSDQENLCLITGEQLLKDSIKLECSHSFNYIPLFNEVKKQKGNFIPNSKPSNYYESDRLNKYQFKCPYCRKKYNGLLPPNSDGNGPVLLYVNYPLSKCIFLDKCKYIFASGLKKNVSCNRGCSGEYCKSHAKIMERRQNKKKNKTSIKKTPCNHVLKRGPRKGQCCGKNSRPPALFCKAHCTAQLNTVITNITTNIPPQAFVTI